MSEVENELHAQIDKARTESLHFSHLDSHMIALDNVISMNPGISKRDWFPWYKQNLASLNPESIN